MRFNLTLEEFQVQLAKQGEVCAICKCAEVRMGNGNIGKIKTLSLDHNHRTNKPRGIICQNCNLAIGMMQDNPERADDIAQYLRSWQDG